MPERITLLAKLVDDEVIAVLKARLGAEGIADLVMEIVNPYRRLSTEEQARLGDVSERTIRDRKARGDM